MRRTLLSPDALLELLELSPVRIAGIAQHHTAAQLQAKPELGAWSANDVLAHLRSCCDVWGSRIERIVAEDHPTIRAINPTTWILQTDYPDLDFAVSLAAFTTQRTALLAFLRGLDPAAWNRTGRVIGAGSPVEHSVHGYVDSLARHERTHIKQMQRAVTSAHATT